MRISEIVVLMIRRLCMTSLTRAIHPAVPVFIRVREGMRVITQEIRIIIIRSPGFQDDRAHAARRLDVSSADIGR